VSGSRDARDARTGKPWGLGQRLKNDALYLGVRAALRIVDRLPARLLLALGRGLGWAAYWLCPALRATARRNVTLALPERSESGLARGCFVRAGENLATSLLLRRARCRALELVQVGAPELALLRETLAEGRGAVFVSAHLGPFELVAAAVAELGYRPAVVVRESYDRRLDPVVDRHRTARGVEVIHRGRQGASSRIVRALRAGRPVGFLPDLGGRVPSQPGMLLGQPVEVPVGPQRVALRARSPVLVGTLAPLDCRGEVPDTRPKSALPRFGLRLCRLSEQDEEALGSRIFQTLSERVRASAEHWLWMAPRFR